MQEIARPRPEPFSNSGQSKMKKGYNCNRSCYPKNASSTIQACGQQLLWGELVEPYDVEPRQNSYEGIDLPVLSVRPAELFEHILSFLPLSYSNHHKQYRDWVKPSIEIYGGVARSVVAADAGVDVRPPTDFDARIYIKRMHDGTYFGRCREVVETFLFCKLRDVCPSLKDSGLYIIREFYFQKQVVIGGEFSLLSIGNSTGKVIDLEFTLMSSKARKHFDDGSVFAIPLSLPQMYKLYSEGFCEDIEAKSMTVSMESAVRTLKSNLLIIRSPGAIQNGLTLYAHALCARGLTPKPDDENAYSQEFSSAFVESSATMLLMGEDPLRFVKGFIRSHYANTPVMAYGFAAQMLCEVSSSVVESRLGVLANQKVDDVYKYLGELIGELVVNASLLISDDVSVSESLRSVTDFIVDWKSFGSKEDGGWDHRVKIWDGSTMRLRRKNILHPSERVDMALLQAAQHLATAVVHLRERECDDDAEPRALLLEEIMHVFEQGFRQDSCRGGATEVAPSGGGCAVGIMGPEAAEAGSPDGPISDHRLGEAECLAWLEEWHRGDDALSQHLKLQLSAAGRRSRSPVATTRDVLHAEAAAAAAAVVAAAVVEPESAHSSAVAEEFDAGAGNGGLEPHAGSAEPVLQSEAVAGAGLDPADMDDAESPQESRGPVDGPDGGAGLEAWDEVPPGRGPRRGGGVWGQDSLDECFGGYGVEDDGEGSEAEAEEEELGGGRCASGGAEEEGGCCVRAACGPGCGPGADPVVSRPSGPPSPPASRGR